MKANYNPIFGPRWPDIVKNMLQSLSEPPFRCNYYVGPFGLEFSLLFSTFFAIGNTLL
jgi:hypothetical protein